MSSFLTGALSVQLALQDTIGIVMGNKRTVHLIVKNIKYRICPITSNQGLDSQPQSYWNCSHKKDK